MAINKPARIKALHRFKLAVEEKAFEGTIPYDSAAAIQAHADIDREYSESRRALEKMLGI